MVILMLRIATYPRLMSKFRTKLYLVRLVSFFLFLLVFTVPAKAANTDISPVPAEERFEAKVIRIIEEKDVEVLNGVQQPYQSVEVEVLEGRLKGQRVNADLGSIVLSNEYQKVRNGDRVIILRLQKSDGSEQFFVEDAVRRLPLLILSLFFAAAAVIIGGWRGLTSFVGLVISLVVILFYVVPRIASGENPVFISVSGSFVILVTSLYLSHGFSRKTTAAVVGTALSLTLTALLAVFFVNFTKLSGLGSEDAAFLSILPDVKINLQGLLLGGIIIGALGVLDDVTISQASYVFELQETNPNLSSADLYRKGLRIGQDHIASVVNTLVLAYVGASLPLLLLFTISSGNSFGDIVNREMMADEIVRTLVGSIGLIMAVPITTFLSVLMAKKSKNVG